MASKTVEDVLFPGIDVRVERVSDSSGALVVEAVSTGRPGRCPDCRRQAGRDIEPGATLSNKVTVTGGARIGANALVGASVVVSHSIPPTPSPQASRQPRAATSTAPP